MIDVTNFEKEHFERLVADIPASEEKPTMAMLDAGVDAMSNLPGYEGGGMYWTTEDAVLAVFRAMNSAR